jgi:hypothetical protein
VGDPAFAAGAPLDPAAEGWSVFEGVVAWERGAGLAAESAYRRARALGQYVNPVREPGPGPGVCRTPHVSREPERIVRVPPKLMAQCATPHRRRMGSTRRLDFRVIRDRVQGEGVQPSTPVALCALPTGLLSGDPRCRR